MNAYLIECHALAWGNYFGAKSAKMQIRNVNFVRYRGFPGLKIGEGRKQESGGLGEGERTLGRLNPIS